LELAGRISKVGSGSNTTNEILQSGIFRNVMCVVSQVLTTDSGSD